MKTCTLPSMAWWTSSTARSSSTRKRQPCTVTTAQGATAQPNDPRLAVLWRPARCEVWRASASVHAMNLLSSLLTASHVALDVEVRDKKALFEQAGTLLESTPGLTRQQVVDS